MKLCDSDRDLQRGRIVGGEQRLQLLDVQVVGGGDLLQPELAAEIVGGPLVGDVEREVAAAWRQSAMNARWF